MQIFEKYKKPTSHLYYEGYFNNFDFDGKSIYLLSCMVTVDTKLRLLQYKILNNILFVNKILFTFRKVESPLCSFCKAEDKTQINLFHRYRKTFILWRQLEEFFNIAVDLPSILPQSAILGFLDDTLDFKPHITNLQKLHI